MHIGRITAAGFVLILGAFSAWASPVTLNTISVNFPLSGNGGGATALLNGTESIEIFCVDFAHTMYVPYQYSANLTGVTSSSDLSLTRFGGVTSWNTVSIAGDVTASSTINGANALGRYQMAAYLTSLYHLSDVPAANAYNNGVQEAIWEILNPADALNPAGIADPTNALVSAATWFASTSVSTRDWLLSNYRILSDATMTNCGPGPRCGGFQEQMVPGSMPAVPEPRGMAVFVLGIVGIGAAVARRRRQQEA